MLQRVTDECITFAFWFDVLFAAPPSDPPDYAKVRAKPLAKPERYKSLTRDAELELIRAYHEDGDLDELDRLVGAHRPMVVRLARRFARGDKRKLETFVEYGMLGLIEAAAPPRPSKTKKGAIVCFDPSKYSFSAYSRKFAEAMMRTATPDWEPPQHVIDSKMEFDAWAKTPIPDEIEEAVKDRPREDCEQSFAQEMTEVEFGEHRFHDMWRDEGQAPAQRPVDPTKRFEQIKWLRALFGILSVLDYDDDVILPRPKPQPRRTRITDTEYAAKDKHYAGYWGKFHSFLSVAHEGMEGWGDKEDLDGIDGAEDEFMVATFFRNHAQDGKQYRLPKEVLLKIWKLACKRYGKKLKYEVAHRGLGNWDKFGAKLKLPFPDEPRCIIPRAPMINPLCIKLASIYLMKREMRQYLILLAAGLYIHRWRLER